MTWDKEETIKFRPTERLAELFRKLSSSGEDIEQVINNVLTFELLDCDTCPLCGTKRGER